ncbi:MAG: hypothetical protein ND895_15680 [Pyrinomonadaceae bacterium]|nr:hypothetical protein [Pyrinomonadaceae bacterium]
MRRKVFALAAFPASFVLGVCSQIAWLSSPPVSGRYEPETLQETVSPDYNLTGVYYGAHEFPWVFDNVRRIDLTTTEFRVNPDSSVTVTPTAPRGYLVTAFDIYKMSRVDVDGGRLSFTTEPRTGMSYQFTGRVLAEGYYPIKGYSQYRIGKTVMVEGRIVRMLFGFKVAESEVRFTKGSGC